MKATLKKNWHIWAIAAIMVVAFFVRIWELSDTLYFNMDQARDASISRNALKEGPGMLPLLGPRAAGTFLRLGPVFYYFQYLSALLNQSAEPVIFVYPEIFFSVLTIPLLYIFLRKFFQKDTSVILVGLYGLSFMIVQYSRFAWNPNQTVFWSILFLLCIFNTSLLKDKKKSGWWLLGGAFAYGILSQLHFTALLTFPIIAILFWLFYRPKGIRPIFWIGAVMIMIFMYFPMLLSELQTDWDNANQFYYALNAKGEERSLLEKTEKSLRLHGEHYSLFLTSYGSSKNIIYTFVFFAMMGFAVWRGVDLWKNSDTRQKRAFLVLCGIWFAVFFLFFTNLSFTVLKPRFWLLISAIPFIVLGMFFEWIYRTGHKKRGRVIAGVVAAVLLFTNSYAIGYWYWSVHNQKHDMRFVRWLELKQDNLVSIKQLRDAIDYMVVQSIKNDKQICYNTDNDYKAVYMYLFKLYYPEVPVKRMNYSTDSNRNCLLFAIENGGSPEKPRIKEGYESFYSGTSSEQFGSVSIWSLRRDDLKINEYFDQKNQQEKMKKEQQQKEEDDSSDDELEKPDRKERVFWKNIFSGDYKP
jgi:4-amino-4-deoxy-L-arabinose transferase-like glycosyltransferase